MKLSDENDSLAESLERFEKAAAASAKHEEAERHAKDLEANTAHTAHTAHACAHPLPLWQGRLLCARLAESEQMLSTQHARVRTALEFQPLRAPHRLAAPANMPAPAPPDWPGSSIAPRPTVSPWCPRCGCTWSTQPSAKQTPTCYNHVLRYSTSRSRPVPLGPTLSHVRAHPTYAHPDTWARTRTGTLASVWLIGAPLPR